jgi:predicted polyphosphate/ATP-dependent NAD kinase
MVLIKKITVDINNEVRESFICDGQYILPETYYMLEGELEEEFEEDMDFKNELAEYNYDEEDYNENCDKCEFSEYEDDDESDFGQTILDAIDDTFEMFENSTTCDDCKKKALIDLILLGVDGAMQGCIVRE